MATTTKTYKTKVPKWNRDRTLLALLEKQRAKKNKALAVLLTKIVKPAKPMEGK